MAEKKVGKTSAVKSAAAADKLYTIVSKQNGKAIEAGEEDVVYIMKASRRKNQQWKLEPTEDGYVKVLNAATGKVLDVVWEGTDNGAQIHQWEYMGGANQQWVLEKVDGACKLKGKASGKCLDIVEMSTEDGAKLQIWDDCNGDNQQWILKEIKTAVPKAASSDEKPKKTAPKAKKAPPAESKE